MQPIVLVPHLIVVELLQQAPEQRAEQHWTASLYVRWASLADPMAFVKRTNSLCSANSKSLGLKVSPSTTSVIPRNAKLGKPEAWLAAARIERAAVTTHRCEPTSLRGSLPRNPLSPASIGRRPKRSDRWDRNVRPPV